MPASRDPFRLLTGNGRPPSLLGRIVAGVAAIGLFVLAFTVSLFVLAGALALGLVAWGWIMWKTRALRRDLRAQRDRMQRTGAHGVTIIEGEVVRNPDREPPAP